MVKRYEFLKLLAPKITDELVVTTIAGTAKEWHQLKPREGNLINVYMSGATPLALGIAVSLPHRRVISLDADGSLLMSISALAAVAYMNPPNLIVVVFDNGCYEAAGGISTFTAGTSDLAEIARGTGIKYAITVKDLLEFEEAIEQAFHTHGATVIVVKVTPGTAAIPSAAMDGSENKYHFMRYIETTENIKISTTAKIEDPSQKKM